MTGSTRVLILAFALARSALADPAPAILRNSSDPVEDFARIQFHAGDQLSFEVCSKGVCLPLCDGNAFTRAWLLSLRTATLPGALLALVITGLSFAESRDPTDFDSAVPSLDLHSTLADSIVNARPGQAIDPLLPISEWARNLESLACAPQECAAEEPSPPEEDMSCEDVPPPVYETCPVP